MESSIGSGVESATESEDKNFLRTNKLKNLAQDNLRSNKGVLSCLEP